MKALLKTIKLNEETISILLGVLVILAVGMVVINYIRGIRQNQVASRIDQQAAQKTLPPDYTVQKGDHLWGIAQKYYESGYNWVDIAKANNLTNANIIKVGQKLTLPQVPAKPATTTQIQKPAAQVTITPILGDSYTVQKGDHLWGIAVRAYGDGYQWTKIAKENKLKNPNLIFSDNVLKLPR